MGLFLVRWGTLLFHWATFYHCICGASRGKKSVNIFRVIYRLILSFYRPDVSDTGAFLKALKSAKFVPILDPFQWVSTQPGAGRNPRDAMYH
jgi:hypothetical protein